MSRPNLLIDDSSMMARETPVREYEEEERTLNMGSSFIKPSPVVAPQRSPRFNEDGTIIGGRNRESNISKYPDLPNFEMYEFDEMEEVLERIIKENEFVEEELYIFEAFLKKMSERNGVAQSQDRDLTLNSSAIIKNEPGSQLATPTHKDKVEKQKQQQPGVPVLTSESISEISDNRMQRRKSIDNASVSSFDDGSDDASSVVSSGTTGTGKKKKKRRQAVQEYQLTYENKIEIGLKAIDILRNTIEKENKIYEKEIESMRARVQEADLEIEEVDKEHLEFRKEVVEPKEARNPNDKVQLGSALAAEKIVQYFKNKQQQKDTLLHKLKLKISEMRKQVAKSKTQLESREQSGDQLTKTDFDQLKIENGLMNKKIDERNKELVDLKLNTGALLQKLSALTEKLNLLNQDSKLFNKDIEKSKNDLDALKEEIEFVLKDKDIESNRNQKMVAQHEQVKVPEILSYIKLKAELDMYRKELANWQRKVEIQSMNESNTRKKLQGMFMAGKQRVPSAGSTKSESSLSGILTTNNQLSSKQLFKNM